MWSVCGKYCRSFGEKINGVYSEISIRAKLQKPQMFLFRLIIGGDVQRGKINGGYSEISTRKDFFNRIRSSSSTKILRQFILEHHREEVDPNRRGASTRLRHEISWRHFNFGDLRCKLYKETTTTVKTKANAAPEKKLASKKKLPMNRELPTATNVSRGRC